MKCPICFFFYYYDFFPVSASRTLDLFKRKRTEENGKIKLSIADKKNIDALHREEKVSFSSIVEFV